MCLHSDPRPQDLYLLNIHLTDVKVISFIHRVWPWINQPFCMVMTQYLSQLSWTLDLSSRRSLGFLNTISKTVYRADVRSKRSKVK